METTQFYFSNSLSLANEFAIKLLSGLLNVRTNHDADGDPLIEIKHATANFTTERMTELSSALSGFRLCKLSAGGIEKDPDSPASRNEVRLIMVHGMKGDDIVDTFLASFVICREYLGGEDAPGWTPWRVKMVKISPDTIDLELFPEYLSPDDREPIWGTRPA